MINVSHVAKWLLPRPFILTRTALDISPEIPVFLKKTRMMSFELKFLEKFTTRGDYDYYFYSRAK